MTKVYIGFGSNKGDKISFLKKAFELLDENKSTNIIKISSIYETKPYGDVPQGNFYNGALILRTDYNLNELFVFLKDVEKKVGRTPSVRWGPREIDLDILIFGEVVEENDTLTIPHKGILNRDFVIRPLLEIEPEIKLPGKNILLKDVDLSNIEKNVLDEININFAY